MGNYVYELVTPGYIFRWFGRASNSVFTALVLIGSLMMLINGLIRVYQELRTYGCDDGRTLFRLLPAFCGCFSIPKELMYTLIGKKGNKFKPHSGLPQPIMVNFLF